MAKQTLPSVHELLVAKLELERLFKQLELDILENEVKSTYSIGALPDPVKISLTNAAANLQHALRPRNLV